ncbi:MAG TPA: UbiD family decarboxylase [Candidatus Binatia bacterium]
MFRDLREFLNVLNEKDELLTVAVELSADQEAAAAIRLVEECTGKATRLSRVNGSPFSIVGSLLGHRRRVELAFGSPRDLIAFYAERRKELIPPKSVKDGPVKEVVHNHNIDVPGLVPVLTHHEGDIGPYLTSAIAVARDPETGKLSCGIHRVQVKGGDKIGILLNNPPIAAFLRKAEARNNPLPIAFVIGCDPLTLLGSVIRAPDGEKFAIGGGLAGRAIEMVRCLNSDLEVPAHAEFVIEGEILPGVRETEGPFGESSGYYLGFESPVGRIKSLMHRKDAIYHALVPFSGEDSTLSEFLWEAENLPGLKQKFPSLARIHIPPRSLGLTVLAAVDPTPHTDVKALIEAIWRTMPVAKNVVVVDRDVHLEGGADLLWALSTRLRADQGLWTEKGGRGMGIDPSVLGGQPVTRVGIDATALADDPVLFRRVDAAEAVRDRVGRLLKPYL